LPDDASIGAAPERREGGLRAQPASVRPGGEQLGGTDHSDARLGQQPRGEPTNQRVELGAETVGLGVEGEHAAGGAAQPR
jgi:hypothetical protein